MAVYPPKVGRCLESPRRAGTVSNANAVGTSASFECGCFVRVSLSIDPATAAVRSGGFQSNGCGFMIAAADVIAKGLEREVLTDLHSLNEAEFTGRVEAELGDFPPERRQCIHVVLEAVRAAFADHRARVIEEFRGEKALICTCFGVSEESIEAFIAEHSPETVDEVTAARRAGAGCGSCRMLIQEMIDDRESRFR